MKPVPQAMRSVPPYLQRRILEAARAEGVPPYIWVARAMRLMKEYPWQPTGEPIDDSPITLDD